MVLPKLKYTTLSLVCACACARRSKWHLKWEEKWRPLPAENRACAAHLKKACFCLSGGDEPGEAQLGAPQWGPPCPDHSWGHAQPGQDQTPAGHQRGQETAGARCEYQPELLGIIYYRQDRRINCVTRRECTVLVCIEGGRGLSVQKVCVCVFFVCLCVWESMCKGLG